MNNLFGNLSYNKESLSPHLQPLQEIKGLMNQKQKHYDYVVDAHSTLEKGLNNLPYIKSNEKDAKSIKEAKDYLTNTYNSFGVALEDKMLDTKKLVKDVSTNYGLNEIQANAMARSKGIAELNKRIQDGNVNEDYANAQILKADEEYKGVSKNKDTGLFSGTYTLGNVAKHIKVNDRLLDALDNFKANKIQFKTKDGSIIHRDNSGALYTQDNKTVTEQELLEAARSYVEGDPQIKSQIENYADAKLYLKFKNKPIEDKDLESFIASNGLPNTLMNKLGILPDAKGKFDKEEILENLKTSYGDNKNAIKEILKEQDFLKSAKPLILKEGFKEENIKLLNGTDFKAKSKTSNNTSNFSLTTIDKVAVQDSINPNDLSKIREDKQNALNSIGGLKETIKNLEESNPNDISNAALLQAKKDLQNAYNTIDKAKDIEKGIRDSVSKDVDIDFKSEYSNYKNNVNKYIEKELKKFNTDKISDTMRLYHNKHLAKYEGVHPNIKKLEKDDLYLKYRKHYNDLAKQKETLIANQKEKLLNQHLLDENEFIDRAINKAVSIENPSNSNTNVNSEPSFLSDVTDAIFNPNATNSYNGDNNSSINNLANKISPQIKRDKNGLIINPQANVFTIDKSSTKVNPKLQAYSKLMGARFSDPLTRQNFKYKDMDLNTYLNKKSDYNVEDFDINKTKISIGVESENGKVPYYISIPSKTKDKEDIVIKTTYDSDDTNKLHQEVLNEELENYIDLNNKGELTGFKKLQFENFALSYLDSSDIGKQIDGNYLYSRQINDRVKINLDTDSNGNETNVFIVPKKVNKSNKQGEAGFNMEAFDKATGKELVFGNGNEGLKFYVKDDIDKNNVKTFTSTRELKKLLGAQMLLGQNNLKNKTTLPPRPKGTSLSVYHKNAGNLKYTPFTAKFGAKKGQADTVNNDGTHYAYFDNPQQSIIAMKALYKTGRDYKNKTVKELTKVFKKYSSGENDEGYGAEIVANVPELQNIDPNTQLKNLPDNVLNALIKAQIKQEDITMYNNLYFNN